MARVVVIGAGMGGMAAAARLAVKRHDVTVIEQSATYGGKLGTFERDGFVFDTGPSLLTLPAVYRDLFNKTGAGLDETVDLVELEPAFRYRFPDGVAVEMPGVDSARCAVALGASDYVLKGSTRKVIVDVILATAAGQSPSSGGELHSVARMMNTREVFDDDQAQLTGRETQVLRHLALGLSNAEIGLSLKISVETVKEHVQNVLRKLAVKDRTQAAVWAVHKGLA